MDIERISSIDRPDLAVYRTLKRPDEHARMGLFVAEGEKVVRRLIDSGIEVISMLLTPEWLQRLQESGHLTPERSVRIYVAESDRLREIVGFNLHQGIMAIGRIPPDPGVDAIPARHFLVALDGLRTSENVGVIVRNCAAFGVDAILAGENSCSPYLRRAVRNSMGAVFKIPIHPVVNLAETLRRLQALYKTKVIAADPHGASNLYDHRLEGNICVVLGNEDYGISAEVSAVADLQVRIPMNRETDSLNVGCASAVFLYETACSRQKSSPRIDTDFHG
jgi:tRNA G18 (ribose-2'-O)-methylase SpoU